MASGPSAGGFQGQYPQPPQQGGQQLDPRGNNPHLGKRQPQLTKEEISVLEECNRESFWARCLPIGLSFGAGAGYLVHTGVLKGSARFGPLPKSMAAMFVGYIIGKLSYQGTCQQKILQQIPDSNLAQAIRKNKGIGGDPYGDNTATMAPEPAFSRDKEPEKMREVYNSFDMPSGGDAVKNIKGLDDSLRPSLDRDVKPIDEQAEMRPQPTLTYEELRNRNRQEYERSMAAGPNSPFRQRPFPPPRAGGSGDGAGPGPAPPSAPAQQKPAAIWDAPPSAPTGTYGSRGAAGRQKNQWGDVWDDN